MRPERLTDLGEAVLHRRLGAVPDRGAHEPESRRYRRIGQGDRAERTGVDAGVRVVPVVAGERVGERSVLERAGEEADVIEAAGLRQDAGAGDRAERSA